MNFDRVEVGWTRSAGPGRAVGWVSPFGFGSFFFLLFCLFIYKSHFDLKPNHTVSEYSSKKNIAFYWTNGSTILVQIGRASCRERVCQYV